MEWFKRQKWWQKTLIVLVGLGIIGSFLPDGQSTDNGSGDSAEQSSDTTLSATTSTVPEVDWYSNLVASEARETVTASVCEGFEAVLRDKGKAIESRLANLAKNAPDAYSAAEYFETTDWETTQHRKEIARELQEIGQPILGEVSLVAPSQAQVDAFISDSLVDCGLADLEVFDKAQELDTKISSLVSGIANLPWYPKDFQLYEENIAYRFLSYSKGEYRCSYSGAYCWGIEIVTQSGCNNLYAELTILDSTGRNIGFTNDTTSGVRAKERVILVFDTFENGADQGRLAKVSCY
jgi:hypothetical protein